MATPDHNIFEKRIPVPPDKRVEMLTPERARELYVSEKFLLRCYVELGITSAAWICLRCRSLYLASVTECADCAEWYFHQRDLSDYERERVLRLARNLCWYCGCDLTGVASIDHQQARAIGGGHRPENLVAACRRCNSQKGKRTVAEYRAYLESKSGRSIVFFGEMKPL